LFVWKEDKKTTLFPPKDWTCLFSVLSLLLLYFSVCRDYQRLSKSLVLLGCSRMRILRYVVSVLSSCLTCVFRNTNQERSVHHPRDFASSSGEDRSPLEIRNRSPHPPTHPPTHAHSVNFRSRTHDVLCFLFFVLFTESAHVVVSSGLRRDCPRASGRWAGTTVRSKI